LCAGGLGRNILEQGVRECRAAGYLRRWQAASSGHGSFSRAAEFLALPDAGKAGWCEFARRAALPPPNGEEPQ